MLIAQQDDFKCQQYASTIGLLTSTSTKMASSFAAPHWIAPYKQSSPLNFAIASFPFLTHPLHKDTRAKPKLTRPFAEHFTGQSWPVISTHVQSCRSGSKSKDRRRKKHQKTKLFPPTGPLDDITIELLGPLPKTRNDNNHILLITYW